MFDFNNVRPSDGKQSAGFEALCVQLFEGIAGAPLLEVRRIDGAGGDGGVEVIAKRDGNRLIGLQAKFFVDAFDSRQIAQIRESVKQAMVSHPNLREYYVCVPRDRTPGQQKRWDAETAQWRARHPRLKVIWVGRSELSELLIQDRWAYLAVYWLGAPDFSLDQLRDLAQASVLQLHSRYTPKLHHRTLAELELGPALGIDVSCKVYAQDCRKLAAAARALMGLAGIREEPATTPAPPLLRSRGAGIEAARNLLTLMKDGSLLAQDTAFAGSLSALVAALDALLDEIDVERARLRQEGIELPSRAQDARSKARDVLNAADAVLRTAELRDQARAAPVWLLTGEAGSGKSHLLATLTQRALAEGQAAVLLLGEQFQGNLPLPDEFSALAGGGYPMQDLLRCLQAHAQLTGRPSVLIVDAVNESPNRQLWATHLLGLVAMVSKHPGVHLLLSCRSDWVDDGLPPSLTQSALHLVHRGFDLDFAAAVRAYFEGYQVSADAFPPLIPEFRNPLFLKTVCETFEGGRLPAEPLSFLEVLRQWERRICDTIRQRIDCPAVTTARAIERILLAMARDGTTAVSFEEARGICLAEFAQPADSQSLYRQLVSCGLLVEVTRDRQLFVRLQYERFYDVRVAEAELTQMPSVAEWHAFWRSKQNSLMRSDDHHVRSARLFAYSLLLPERFGIELVDCELPQADSYEANQANRRVWDQWLDSLAWRRVPQARAQVRGYFARWARRKRPQGIWMRLLSFSCIEGHPLNADFLHLQLSKWSMAERDESWSAALAGHDLDDPQDELAQFAHWCDGASARCSSEQARLAATVLIWLTTTTNRATRDRATDVAIRLLAQRPKAIQGAMDSLWDVNDPYVKERLLACLAGVLPSLEDEDAQALGRDVVHRFYGDRAAVPLNLLQREYASFIAQYCEHRHWLSPELQGACRGPYPTPIPRIMDESQVLELEQTEGYHTVASSLYPEEMGPGMYGDFGRYVMGSAVHRFVDASRPKADARSDYDRFPREDARIARRYIWTRIVEFGWTPARFGAFERGLGYHGRSQASIERISKKYQWIGLYEYLGHLADHRQFAGWSGLEQGLATASALSQRDYAPAAAFWPSNASETDGPESIDARAPNPVPQMKNAKERSQWALKEDAPFLSYLHTCIESAPRLVLSAHHNFEEQMEFGVEAGHADHATQWIDIRSFLVPAEQADEFALRLQPRSFFGNGCDTPDAHAVWTTEYPWHAALNDVNDACGTGQPWLRAEDGTFMGIECKLSDDDRSITLPAPAVAREMSTSRSIGQLSAVQPCPALGWRMTTAGREPVLWGTTASPRMLAVNYELFCHWLRERGWALVWCVLSSREARVGYELLLAEGHQSEVIVLQPFAAPRVLRGRHELIQRASDGGYKTTLLPLEGVAPEGVRRGKP